MANRVEIPIVVLSNASPTSPVAGATAIVKNRSTGKETTVYSDSGTTNNTITQPLTTDSAGRLTGWLPRGAYEVEIVVSGTIPYIEYLDIAPGSDGAVDATWLANTLKPSQEATGSTEALRALGMTASTAAAGNDSRLSDERVPKKESTTEEKLGDGAATSRKVKLTRGIIRSSEELKVATISGIFQQVPGALLEITPVVASVLQLTVVMATTKSGILTETEESWVVGGVEVDGIVQTDQITIQSGDANVGKRTYGMEVYDIPLTAAKHTIKLVAKRISKAESVAVPIAHGLWALYAS